MGDGKPQLLAGLKMSDHLRHELGKKARTLATAKHQQLERIHRPERRIGCCLLRDHQLAHRISGDDQFGLYSVRQIVNLVKRHRHLAGP